MSPPSAHDPLAEGIGWRELAPAPDVEDRWPFRPPLVTRRADEVALWGPAAWEAAVGKAQAVYRRTGVRGGTPEAPQWTAARGRRWVRMEAEPVGAGGRLTIEYVRPEPRPWLLAVSLLCVPTALVGVTVLLSRPAGLFDWAVVGGLLAVPLGAGAIVAAVEWVETLGARWRARRVARAVRKAVRRAAPVWVAAAPVGGVPPDEAEPETPDPALLPEHVAPAEWLSSHEIADIDGATPAAPEPAPTLVWPVETLLERSGPAAAPEATLVWPGEAPPPPARRAPEPAAPPSAVRDVPFAAVRLPAPAPPVPHGDGVRAPAAQLPRLEVVHLRDLEPAPPAPGGDGRAGPPPELGPVRRPPEPAGARPPEPRAARVVPTRPVSSLAEPTDVFTEWHPTPPWAWE